MNIEKIYIDMDDVLADFTSKTMEMGFILDKKKDKAKEDDRMWEMIKPIEHYYASLKPMPGAIEMFKALVNKFGEEKIEILTGIPKPYRGIKNAEEDKRKWVKEYLSNSVKVNVVLREEKPKYCKGKGYILIDDNKNNCKDWENAGGTAIKFVSADDIFKTMDIKDDIIGRLNSEFETWESVDKYEEKKFHDQVIADAKTFLIKHKKAFEELAK